ncbi:MAG TPA: hypothetical protein VLL52_03095, partial [Anaerolineae bacterium]|nr:hypothetical protein [Anaerolineae bacterium]
MSVRLRLPLHWLYLPLLLLTILFISSPTTAYFPPDPFNTQSTPATLLTTQTPTSTQTFIFKT